MSSAEIAKRVVKLTDFRLLIQIQQYLMVRKVNSEDSNKIAERGLAFIVLYVMHNAVNCRPQSGLFASVFRHIQQY